MTYFLLLLAAFTVAGVGWLVRRNSQFWGQTLLVLGCVGCLAVMVWQVRQTLFPPAPKPTNRAHAVVSYYLASQTQQEIIGRSGVVAVVFPPPSIMSAEDVETYGNAFSAPLLRGRPELRVEIITLEPPAKGKGNTSGGVSLAGLKQAVAKTPNALAYVIYAPVPADIGELFSPGSTATTPPCFLFDPDGGVNWLTALKQGRIRSVIVPRPGVELAKGTGVVGGPGELFGQFFFLATPANADQIAGQLGAPRTAGTAPR